MFIGEIGWFDAVVRRGRGARHAGKRRSRADAADLLCTRRMQKREEVRLTRRSGYAFTFLRFLATAVESAAGAAALALRRLKLRVVAAAAPYCIALLTPTQLRMASTNRAAALASAVSDAKMA